ncbi:UNVERIFIED_CONTAM: hypothetical protein PYX00_009851 [Menopon gallinae]|uniref:Amino acid transporter transmembrane domain-containing protein n=1 Tax=Menopon gallinae TaxID=328185 RepID=A0AAW2HD95_9NEOP
MKIDDEKEKNRYSLQMENFSSTAKLADDVSKRKSEEAMASENYNPFENRKIDNPTTFNGALAHLLKSSLGSGILAMPMAFKNGGLAFGLVGTVVVGFICAHCVHMLVRCSHILSKRIMVPSLTFAGTAEAAFETGPPATRRFSSIARQIINSALVLTYYAGNTIYVVFIASSIQQVVEYHLSPNINIRLYILMIWVPLMVLCLVRDLKNLVPFSVTANLFIVASFAITLYYMFTDIPDMSTRNQIASFDKLPLFFATVIFAMEGIGTVMPIENHMKEPEKFLSCCGVLQISMSVVVVLYGVIGFFGYLKFGEETEGSVTLNLPVEDILAQVVKILIAIAIFFTYALQFYVPTSIVWEIIQHKFPPHKERYYNYALRMITVTGTVILAAAVPNLGPIISLVGSVCFSVLGLLLPAVIDLVTRAELGYGAFKWIFVKDVIIMVIAIIALCAGTYTSFLDIIHAYT